MYIFSTLQNDGTMHGAAKAAQHRHRKFGETTSEAESLHQHSLVRVNCPSGSHANRNTTSEVESQHQAAVEQPWFRVNGPGGYTILR